eukprot:s825_g22.t1
MLRYHWLSTQRLSLRSARRTTSIEFSPFRHPCLSRAQQMDAAEACLASVPSVSFRMVNQEKLAIKAPRPKTAVDALEEIAVGPDKYRGVDPLAIIDDLERVKSGGDGLPTMDEIEEKKRIAEEEEKEKEREKERERQRQEQAEQTKKDLALAKEQAVQMEQERKRKREAAQDLIAAMLDAEDAAAPPAASAATAASAEVPAPALEAEERRQKLLQQAEELRKKQEEMKQRQQAEDDAQRQRMRERRQRRAGAAEAATEAATEAIAATVVLD